MNEDLRASMIERYERGRERSRALFGMLTEAAYYSQPIALRHPIAFYDGHLPGFAFNTLVRKALGGASIDERLESLFARGIDPDDTQGVERASPDAAASQWPSPSQIRGFADEADRRVVDALRRADSDRPGHALLEGAEAVFTILEHEAMHQETLLYMWHRLPLALKSAPPGYQARVDGVERPVEWIDVPGGVVTLGVDSGMVPFSWDNERPACRAETTDFAVERDNVTNGRFLEFVEAGGYTDERWWAPEDWAWLRQESVQHPLFWERDGSGWRWRGLFDLVRLPPAWPVYVSLAEASAFARWRGARLLTEAEFQRAAYGAPDGERQYPWGAAPPTPSEAVVDFAGFDPVATGSCPAGASAWGVEDLVGNGWEWTSTPFAPFPGFRPSASYPEYSADFFDGEHFVLKGASPVTSRELVRPTFRNWFRARYPYVYATFRLARPD